MGIDVSICRPAELDSSQLRLWREFQSATPDLHNPFLTPEFVQVFGKYKDCARVGVIEDSGEIIGFFPFESAPLGTARALGYGLADAQGIVHAAGAEWGGVRNLMKRSGIALMEFDHMIAAQAADLGRHTTMAPSPIVEVGTCDWGEWLKNYRAKGKGRRIKSALEKRRKLEREHGKLRFVYDSRDEQLLETLMGWKSNQYRRTGRFDRFAKPWFRDLVHELHKTRSGDFTSRLSVLYVEDRPVTIDFSIASHGILAGWFPSYDVDYSRYSPGFNGILNILEAISTDPEIDALDMGKGESDYKESLKTKELLVGQGWVQDTSLQALAWRARTAPRRHALNVVLSNPQLRLAARKTLKAIGGMRGKK